MSYIRRNFDFNDFLDSIGIALFILIVFMFLIWVLGSAIYGSDHIAPKTAEQNIYLSLKGEKVDDETAVKTANLIKNIYSGQVSPKNLEDIKEITSVSRTYLGIAVGQKDNIELILNNPETDIKIDVPTWGNWFKIAGITSWLLLGLFLSVNYVLTSRYDEWWQYPWNKWWAYPMAIAMHPYVIFIQSGVGIYALLREVRGEHALERRFIEEDRIKRQKELLEKKISSMSSNAESYRKKWISLQDKNSWKREIDGLKNDIARRQTDLLRLGENIEQKQRALAENKTRLAEIEKTAKEKLVEKTMDELSREFDELWRLPGLKAFEITGSEIKLYTDNVRMKQNGCESNFLVRVDIGSGRIEIENFVNDGKQKIEFCFGDNVHTIKENVKKKNYLPVIAYILRAIQN